jgi:dolichol-phosphate mannosyltransferase
MTGVEISVVVPVYRELSSVLERQAMPYEIIFVDDQSDATLEILKRIQRKDDRVKLISLSRNFGHQIALTAGMDFAAGDAVIMLDADLQHPPEMIPELVKQWKEGYDIVYTIREDVRGESFLKKLSSRTFYALMSKIAEIDMDFNTADFRLMSRKAVDGFDQIREKARFMRGLVSWIGYRKTGVKYVGAERSSGRSKYSLRRLLQLALDGILSFSLFPIRVISATGLIVSFFSFIYILRVIYFVVFTTEKIPDLLPIATLILLFLGVNMVMTGIIGEYVAKVFIETKNRPLYLVDRLYGFERKKS